MTEIRKRPQVGVGVGTGAGVEDALPGDPGGREEKTNQKSNQLRWLLGPERAAHEVNDF